jgi:hypothetical protein
VSAWKVYLVLLEVAIMAVLGDRVGALGVSRCEEEAARSKVWKPKVSRAVGEVSGARWQVRGRRAALRER